MIETKTVWQDSGFDCDHCGGEVSRRIDKETGQPDRICLQCLQCGCQWRPNGSPLRTGNLKQCKQAQRERGESPEADLIRASRLRVVAAVVFALILIRFGGLSLVRFILPLVLLFGIFYLVRNFGKEQQWW